MKSKIPPVKEIAKQAYERIQSKQPEMLDVLYVRDCFSTAVELYYRTCYEIYQEYEQRVIANLTHDALARIHKDTLTKTEVEAILKVVVGEAIKTEIHLKQSRYARAGQSFEIVVRELLKLIGIPSEHMTREDKASGLRRIDLVVPDRKTAIDRPDKAHFLSLKTSLKDRWKLVVEDQRPNQRTHLLTLLQNESLSTNVIDKIMERGIFLYIPDSIKMKYFQNDKRVRCISELPQTIN